jgi:hypothetical protein
VWQFLASGAVPFMHEAVRAFGRQTLTAEEEGAATDTQVAAGRRLMHLVFGTQDDGPQLPDTRRG